MKKFFVASAVFLLALTACGGTPGSGAEVVEEGAASQEITFALDGFPGETMLGTLYGEGPVGVILSHMGSHESGHLVDQTSWQPFAQALAEEGYLVLTYDARGFGQNRRPQTGRGILASQESAVDFMRDQGVEQIILIGAGMGGTASARVAAENENGDITGLALISSREHIFTTETSAEPLSDEELAALTMPSLWLVGSDDDNADNMQTMFDLAGSPDKELHIYEDTDLRGTDLFEHPEYGPDLQDRLIAFVAHVASSGE